MWLLIGSQNFPVELESLHKMLAFVVEAARTMEFSEAELAKVELAAEEALVNVIQHSGLNSEVNLQLTCLHAEHEGFQLRIQDPGSPYDPLKKASNAGNGLLLIQQLMDKISYSREEGVNTLSLMKYRREM